MSDRLLDRIGKVLHQAENASTPEEAATYMAKAQELASANAIDLAIARAHQADKTKREEPTSRRITVDPYSWRRSPSTKWKVELLHTIAVANDLQCLLGTHSVHAFGFPSDIDVTEALYNSLVIQMVSGADAALKRGDNKVKQRKIKRIREVIPEDEREWGGWDRETGRDYAASPEEVERYGMPEPPKTRLVRARDAEGNLIYEEAEVSAVDGRVFRANFYEGFIARVSSRLWEAKRAARKAYDDAHSEDQSTEVGIVLRSKALAVDEALKAHVGDRKLGVYKEPETSQFSALGQVHGQKAAATATLGTEVRVGGGSTRAIGSDR